MVLVGVLLFLPKEKVNAPVVLTDSGIKVFSPLSDAPIISPITITGIVTGNGWTGFEGQVGTVHVLDGTGKELAATFLKATTEWTQLPTNFEATLEFSNPHTKVGSLVFYNENASGDSVRDKTFILPITFK